MTDRQKALTLAALLLVAFNLNCRAIGSRDTRVMEFTALSLATSLNANVDEFPDIHAVGLAEAELQVRGEHVLPNYPVVPAIVAAPVFALAVATGVLDSERPSPEAREAAGKVASSLLIAVACAFLYLLVRRWHPRAPATLVVAAAALGSPYWSTASQALWSHAVAACFLGLAIYVTPKLNESRIAALAAGVAMALAVSSRPLMLPFAAGLVAVSWRSPNRAWLSGAIAVVLVTLATWHFVTFGHVLGGAAMLESAAVHRRTHLVDGAWSLDVLEGASGILLSPSRGLLVFIPILWWATVGSARLWRSTVEARWLIVGPTLLYLTGWSAYAVWWGGHSYGPRYATDLVIPLTLIVSAAFFGPSPAGPIARRLGVLALAWGVSVQAIGAFCYPGGDWNSRPINVDYAHSRLWDWRDPQIVRTVRAGLYMHHLPRLRELLRDTGASNPP